MTLVYTKHKLESTLTPSEAQQAFCKKLAEMGIPYKEQSGLNRTVDVDYNGLKFKYVPTSERVRHLSYEGRRLSFADMPEEQLLSLCRKHVQKSSD